MELLFGPKESVHPTPRPAHRQDRCKPHSYSLLEVCLQVVKTNLEVKCEANVHVRQPWHQDCLECKLEGLTHYLRRLFGARPLA
jgi:hypothetical protein